MTALTAFKTLSGRHLIDAELAAAEGSRVHLVIDPATEQKIGEVIDASPAQIERAIGVANAAQKLWRKVNSHRRCELLHEAAHAMREARALVGEMLTREMGKPYKESVDEATWSATATDYYAEVGRHEAGRVLGSLVVK